MLKMKELEEAYNEQESRNKEETHRVKKDNIQLQV